MGEFRELANRTSRTYENFKLIMAKYGEISDKLTVILEALIREAREMLNEAMKLLRGRRRGFRDRLSFSWVCGSFAVL